MLAYLEWDEALASIFSPLITGGVRVRSLPRTVKSPIEVEEDVSWLFPEWKLTNEAMGRIFRFEISLLITLYLPKRYDDPNTPPGSVEAIECWILSQLSGRVLPRSCSPLSPQSSKLFAPSRGRWYKEIRFSFETRTSPDWEMEVPPVDLIALKEGVKEIWRLP